MDITQMHVAVNLGLQRIASHTYDDFLPQEIDYYLNETIQEYVREKQKILRDTMEESDAVKSTQEDLRTLLTSVMYRSDGAGANEGTLQSSTIYPDSWKVDLGALPNDDFYLYTSSRSQTPQGWKNNGLVSSKQFHMYSVTTSNSPYFRKLPCLLESNSLYVLRSVEDTEITDVLLSYLREPATVKRDRESTANNIDCDLPKHVHHEIVDLCVRQMHQDLIIKQGSQPKQEERSQ